MENLGLSRANTSGFRGVPWVKTVSKWQAEVRHNGVRHRGSYYDTAEEANQEAIEMRNRMYRNNIQDRLFDQLIKEEA